MSHTKTRPDSYRCKSEPRMVALDPSHDTYTTHQAILFCLSHSRDPSSQTHSHQFLSHRLIHMTHTCMYIYVSPHLDHHLSMDRLISLKIRPLSFHHSNNFKVAQQTFIIHTTISQLFIHEELPTKIKQTSPWSKCAVVWGQNKKKLDSVPSSSLIVTKEVSL